MQQLFLYRAPVLPKGREMGIFYKKPGYLGQSYPPLQAGFMVCCKIGSSLSSSQGITASLPAKAPRCLFPLHPSYLEFHTLCAFHLLVAG